MQKLFEILYEDAELLVLNKPADLVCHPTKGDEFSSLISRVRLYLGPGKPAHIINRLDRETSGVTVVAKTAQAAGELGRMWESRAVEKEYLAIVHGHVREDNGLIDAPLGKDECSRVAIKDCVRPDGVPARTEFFVEQRFVRKPVWLPDAPACAANAARTETIREKPFTLLRLLPHTGRKHQIRIHLAHIGHAIVGDKLYGGDEDLYLALVERRLTEEQRAKLMLPHHALHARRVRFLWRGEARELHASPEGWFRALVTGSEPDPRDGGPSTNG